MTPQTFRRARERLKLNQSEMAKMTGYQSQTRISEIEHGKFQPNAAVIRLIDAYLAGYRPADWPH